MLLDIATFAGFAAICLPVFLLTSWLFGRRRKSLLDAKSKGLEAIEGPEPGWLSRLMAGALPLLGKEAEGIQEDLHHAGHYRKSALVEYLATRNGFIVGVLILTGVLAVLADPKSTLPQVLLGIGLVTAILGHMVPRLLLHQQAKGRLDRIDKGLPDALDITGMALTGGLPLRDALERSSREIRFAWPDIAQEFEIIRRQAEAMSMAKALRKFAERIDTPDVKALASLVAQTERLGVHVAASVAEFAEGLRLARRQRAEERANKASVKLLFPIMFCLAPPIWVLMVGPPLLRIQEFFVEESEPGGVLNLDPNAPPTAADIQRIRDTVRERREQELGERQEQ